MHAEGVGKLPPGLGVPKTAGGLRALQGELSGYWLAVPIGTGAPKRGQGHTGRGLRVF